METLLSHSQVTSSTESHDMVPVCMDRDRDIFTEQFSLENILLIHSRLIFHYNCACHIGIIRSVVSTKPVLEQNSKKVRK